MVIFPKPLLFMAFFIFSLASMLAKSGHAQIWTPELNLAWPYIRKYSYISLRALNNLWKFHACITNLSNSLFLVDNSRTSSLKLLWKRLRDRHCVTRNIMTLRSRIRRCDNPTKTMWLRKSAKTEEVVPKTSEDLCKLWDAETFSPGGCTSWVGNGKSGQGKPTV